ncbi:MAG: A/G-specific adenine glycosylase [gamma proteobacterium symbiont of Ctena orbiculata]|uniref:Adenine DNA glycosylase n=1 Tax=Candidatus Thiodiazotropha taylori TaxID=2792791 RepID=A0A944MGC2_9GAMM|nr:A/G-specific adenine glycosylase [Candidatus Thiodiazotropha taylori]PUB85506.1 MAG: A/G-specific adenine glycosylase [gamma proteobacterium symbiont of Ctena orbiculata]MBT2990927.1 A/G-specific adenine glycosylase [Candidatus Thiodiazotropha taylori]MBT2998692.1 A/G-specific adenine glycosylase [Candidatus Thiodiazotropha taylori]MBT3002806.1 A/G-specific adenine glycosylase [Candidatus Thiodiazotropha taylori]
MAAAEKPADSTTASATLEGAEDFSRRVLTWFDRDGRKDLPWQQPRDPYRVWVSEIMLQQTRVNTVIGYFRRFMEAFPDVAALAAAELDQVLHHWSGLGYYARARNLHRAATAIMVRHQGVVPDDIETLQALPGIGRSTAGAIRSLAFGGYAPILDGNVKRVLARHFAVPGWPGRSGVQKQLWRLSEELTPRRRTADYNQAMMDLGATRCLRGRPLCDACPLNLSCRALAEGDPARYPAPKPKKPLPVRTTHMVILSDSSGAVLLEQRPPSGVWGGLWSLPESPSGQPLERWCSDALGYEVEERARLTPRRHSFSHFHLDIIPVVVRMKNPVKGLMDGGARVWYNLSQPDDLGLAAPVSRILSEIRQLDNEQQPEGEAP